VIRLEAEVRIDHSLEARDDQAGRGEHDLLGQVQGGGGFSGGQLLDIAQHNDGAVLLG
jgi:hypothetical protein